MRIQREQDDVVAVGGLELLHRFRGKWMPVAHGHEAASIDSGRLQPFSSARACSSVKRRIGEPPPITE